MEFRELEKYQNKIFISVITMILSNNIKKLPLVRTLPQKAVCNAINVDYILLNTIITFYCSKFSFLQSLRTKVFNAMCEHIIKRKDPIRKMYKWEQSCTSFF